MRQEGEQIATDGLVESQRFFVEACTFFFTLGLLPRTEALIGLEFEALPFH
jgi:hypothetical protein